MGRAQKDLAHMLAKKHMPLHYKRIPFEKMKLKKMKKPTDAEMRFAPSRMKKGTVIGVGVGY